MNPTLLKTVLLTPRRAFAPVVSALFGSGEQGLLIDASYTRSLFQDAAMTIPAVVGMPVVKAFDLSGRGNHLTLTNVTLQQDAAGLKYLSLNGTSSYGVTSAIDFTGTDKMSLFVGAHKANDNVAFLAELSDVSDTNAGTFAVLTYGDFSGRLKGSVANYLQNDFDTAASPVSFVAAMQFDLAGATSAAAIVTRINGAEIAGAATGTAVPPVGGNFGNYAFYLGMRAGASGPFGGRVYGLVVRGASSTAGQIADTERYMARLTGVNF